MRNNLVLSICALALLIATVSWADEAQDRWKTSSRQTDKDVKPLPPVQVEGKAGDGTRSPTQLEPGLAKIEEQFGTQMQALLSDLASAQTAEEKTALQQKAIDLKGQWALALAYRQLELARERKDAASESQIQNDIENMQHPAAVQASPAPRPESDKAVQGGAQ
jgi:hypothetical protein